MNDPFLSIEQMAELYSVKYPLAFTHHCGPALGDR